MWLLLRLVLEEHMTALMCSSQCTFSSTTSSSFASFLLYFSPFSLMPTSAVKYRVWPHWHTSLQHDGYCMSTLKEIIMVDSMIISTVHDFLLNDFSTAAMFKPHYMSRLSVKCGHIKWSQALSCLTVWQFCKDGHSFSPNHWMLSDHTHSLLTFDEGGRKRKWISYWLSWTADSGGTIW